MASPHLMTRSQIRLFSTDLDGTLIGNPEAAWRFTEQWILLEPQRRPLLVYNTGRTVADTQALIAARHLPTPEVIIGSVGTELHDSLYNRGTDFRAQFGQNWDLARVEEIVAATPGVKRQPADLRHEFKSSWFWVRARREDVEDLERRLRAAGIEAAVIYSCRYFLDVVPRRGGKGQALAWLCQRLSIPLQHVLVAGDTANDTAMFLLPGVSGIVVENALPELLAAVVNERTFVARQPMADGVVEGLAHFGVIRNVSRYEERAFV
jgi:sucrose-6-phosphatase